MGPGVVVQHRDLDDSRLQRTLGHGLRLSTAHGFKQCIGGDTVRVEADLERGVGQAHVQHALEGQPLYSAGDGHALEEGFQRHAVAHFGKQVLVRAEAVADRGCSKRFGHDCSFFGIFIERQAKTTYTGSGLCLPDASWAQRGARTTIPAASSALRVASTRSSAPGVSLCRQMESNAMARSWPSTVRTTPCWQARSTRSATAVGS